MTGELTAGLLGALKAAAAPGGVPVSPDWASAVRGVPSVYALDLRLRGLASGDGGRIAATEAGRRVLAESEESETR